MSRPAKGPRLWLRPERHGSDGTRAATWIILDKSNHISTRCKADERALAESKLHLYSRGQWPVEELQNGRLRYIYFVTCDVPNFPIKIGSAFDVGIRLKAIQSALPWDLRTLLVIEGDDQKERELHDLFFHVSMRGEWFARDPSLMEYIDHASNVLLPEVAE